MSSNTINGKNLLFRIIRGPILKVNQRTETSFNASAFGGGGSVRGSAYGNIYNGSGAINGYINGSFAPVDFRYSGGSVTYHEIWFKDENGVELTIELLQSSIRAREGNDVSLIYATVEGDENNFIPIVFINHSTKGHEILMNGSNFLYYKFHEDVIKGGPNHFPVLGIIGLSVGIFIAVQSAMLLPVVILSIAGFTMDWYISKLNRDKVELRNKSVVTKRMQIDKVFTDRVNLAL